MSLSAALYQLWQRYGLPLWRVYRFWWLTLFRRSRRLRRFWRWCHEYRGRAVATYAVIAGVLTLLVLTPFYTVAGNLLLGLITGTPLTAAVIIGYWLVGRLWKRGFNRIMGPVFSGIGWAVFNVPVILLYAALIFAVIALGYFILVFVILAPIL